MSDSPELNWLISVDDHVIEPPDLWTTRLPKRAARPGPEGRPGRNG